MTDRTIPSPADIAARTERRGAPLTAAAAPACQAPATTPAPAAALPVVFGRVRWEQAVMSSGLHPFTRLTALVLAHYAPGGVLPPGGIQNPGGLTKRTGLSAQRVRRCLNELQAAGLIARPSPEEWERRDTRRPITLTMPEASTRTEPPHSGERP